MAELLLGARVESGEPLAAESEDLTTPGVIVGMTGSGKTGLGIVLLEEALLAGVPSAAYLSHRLHRPRAA